ncbi:hypothetical protein [Brevibacterium sp. CT2-23B]|uniref:hypothetical protein n=1 Tax=Brevibacterium sp. CT2-23B TaxID=2729630 RepID=UPI0015521FB9|nr:hypothetical protein [Brevibacterium sp. CT2-23B]
MTNLNAQVLHNYANYLERRFDRLELKELRAPDSRRERQMEYYLNELDVVLELINQIESETK